MILQEMYGAKLNSPETNIIGSISATDTQFDVADIVAVTPDAPITLPILLMIGGSRVDCETVRLTAISGNTLTVERGYESVARAWAADGSGAGEIISANFGAQHHNRFIANMKALEKTIETGEVGGGSSGVELSDTDEPAAGIKTHYRVVQDVPGFIPFTPPDADGNNGAAAFMVATEILAAFAGAKLAELRIFDPEGEFNSVMPVTILEAVKDVPGGRSLLNILAEHYAAIFGHILNSDVHVTAEYITNLDHLLAELVAFTQREDIFVTASQKAAWDLMGQIAANALTLAQDGAGQITDHEARITQLEDSMFNQIHTNPFLVTFGNLTGVIVTRGIHDPIHRRIEC